MIAERFRSDALAERPVSPIRLIHLTDKSKSSELFAFVRFGNQVSQVNQVKRLFDRYGGRGGGEPDAGKRSGKNAALDRPAPAGGTEAAESGRRRALAARRPPSQDGRDRDEDGAAQNEERKMSKKVYGFSSRKWAAFWLGTVVGAVWGGLAAAV